MPKVLLEICCGSADDVIEAARGGADRVELNNNLFQGGLTPSLGTLEIAKERVSIPVMTMVRPRSGGFCYTLLHWALLFCSHWCIVMIGSYQHRRSRFFAFPLRRSASGWSLS